MNQKTYGDSTLPYSRIFRYLKLFVNARGKIDVQLSGQLSTSKLDENESRVRGFFSTDRRLNVRMMAETLDIPKTTVHDIVSINLHIRKMCKVSVQIF